jgi:tetratricopeptide (TPR) repeat protein
MKRLLRIVSILLFVTFVSVPVSVHADVAPPGHPPGANLEPGAETTQVRMMAETVTLTVLASTPKGSLGQAKVTADFTMRNLGSAAESMRVRFPLASNNGFGEYPEVKDFGVKVNGSPVVMRRIMQEDPQWSSDPVPWAGFDVTFPPNQDVNIQVTYLLEGTGEYPFVAFYYLLHTGAGWKDTIGSADLIVRLPYEANPQNVIFDEHTGWSQTTSGGAIQGQEIRWHFENLEPDQLDDFQISLVMPSVWQQVLRERVNVGNNPKDGEAWGRLGKLYKEMFFFRKGYRLDAGGRELYGLSVDAYDKAVTLLPNDALWHAGFAELLAFHAWFSSYDGNDVRPELLRAMQEINTALQISPDDPKVKEIAENIYYSFPSDAIQQLESGYDFLWLTTTPDLSTPTAVPVEPTFTPPAAPTVTNLPAITETAVLGNEATPVPSSTPVTKANPLCGAGFLIPFGVVWLSRRKGILHP